MNKSFDRGDAGHPFLFRRESRLTVEGALEIWRRLVAELELVCADSTLSSGLDQDWVVRGDLLQSQWSAGGTAQRLIVTH